MRFDGARYKDYEELKFVVQFPQRILISDVEVEYDEVEMKDFTHIILNSGRNILYEIKQNPSNNCCFVVNNWL